ncbi:DsbE family thiol:disulfide interchange protein [Kaustia mangrovi]|uniref:DsbE family thiol:disulfide interchange protein n=1 Tax=Kaustia mangrovi TaxID=2593653 RepID=A0A7S8HBB6_9HYPH|nr:DsbE family thiol:disulfide interchange protein [Kaustia mangrovi]QPC42329.1 DsbE family thiol:disulfide interchange protein [Kaustia mangrovi]
MADKVDTRDTSDAPRRRRPWLTLLPVGIFVALAVVFLLRLEGGDPSKVPSPLIGKPVPDFALPGLSGLKSEGIPVPGFSAADLKTGKVTLVNIWASWCVPCRDEHPILMQLASRQDIRVFGINYKDKPENARRFIGLHGNPFEAVGVDEDGRASVDWGVYGVPETFVVNGKGVITFKWIGPMSPEIAKDKIIPAIEAAQGGG